MNKKHQATVSRVVLRSQRVTQDRQVDFKLFKPNEPFN